MAFEASRGTSVLETDLDFDDSVVSSPATVTSFYADHGKRALDLLLGSVLLLVVSPVVLLLAVLVALTSGFPPFYAATRLGKNGRTFRMWKLRSMVRDADAVLQNWQDTDPALAAEYQQNLKLKDDPRVTPLGRVLRRTSLDELPQLLNVVRGEMSLVGPRPYYAAELVDRPDVEAALIRVRPGITGPWQVNGRNAITPDRRMSLDQTYVESVSIGIDFVCLLKTARCLLRANGL